MAELKNTFSWSFSAASDFEECRRKRYWAKYGMWGGWSRSATPEQRKAYQLNKMDNIYSLMGRAVEEGIMWSLRRLQAGDAVTTDEAYQKAVRPLLNGAWKESKEKSWLASPKKYCCLREHYYQEWDAPAEKEKISLVIERARTCLTNFLERVWPRLESVKPESELAIAGVEDGDPEHFTFKGIKIYAIPDYVHQNDEAFHIHDWKAGKPKDAHKDQLALYGLWAHVKHGIDPQKILVYIEYLASGKVAPGSITQEDLQHVEGRISESVADMTDYLVNGDRERNEPVPKEEWDLAVDRRTCERCNFYELCKPELDRLL